MPSTVTELLEEAKLKRSASVAWGTPVPTFEAGVYVVTLGDETESIAAARARCPISSESIMRWLAVRPELTLDGARPSPGALSARVASFWLPDEVILYVGKATSLSTRVRQYYSTPLGARSPHAGGHFLKTLSILGELTVHFATTVEPGAAEDAALSFF